MDVFLPTQQIIKFYEIASRIQNIKQNNIKKEVICNDLIHLWSTLPENKISQQVEMCKLAFAEYLPDFQLTDIKDFMEGAKSMDLFSLIMHEATKETLQSASESMKTVVNGQVQEVNGIKNIQTAASQSFVPSFVKSLLKYENMNVLYSDFNFAMDGVEMRHHFYVSPLKGAPRNLPEEAAGYICLGDTIEQVCKKLNKGFCQDQNVENNPVLEQFKIVFVFLDSVKIEDKEYKTYDEIKADFASGAITPKALKESAAASF